LSGVSHVEFQLQDLNQHNDATDNMADDKNDQEQEHAESEDDTDDDNVELPDLNQEKDKEKPKDNVAEDDYALPHYLNEISDDTAIDPLTRANTPNVISEVIANGIIEQEQHTVTKKSKTGRQEKVIIAPGADGKFLYWEPAQYLEEKAFPHLFPSGSGGYLSTYQPRSVSFANYIKQWIEGVDP